MSAHKEHPETGTALKSYVVVSAYQTDHQRFWSGRRWVVEYPDAEVHTQTSDFDPYAFRNARRAIDGRLQYRCEKVVTEGSPGARDLVVIENYGLNDERIALGSAAAMRGSL